MWVITSVYDYIEFFYSHYYLFSIVFTLVVFVYTIFFYLFDELSIPYRSVSTDILELDEVFIGNGYLFDAMM
ncbi:hypothetical protein NP570_25245, partial [Vibrio parahaemolyticus]|nr:hypothetical protein [Vibrio parahaemolyticus]